jgi:hypothetical protein
LLDKIYSSHSAESANGKHFCGADAMKCRKRGSENNVKNGRRGGVQCFRCRDRGFQFTRETAALCPNGTALIPAQAPTLRSTLGETAIK